MNDCRARGRADIDHLPVKPPKKAKPHRHGLAYWIEQDGHLWLVTRPEKGMLGGMRALPGSVWDDQPQASNSPISVDHSFTHFDLTLHLVHRENPDGGENGAWWPISTLDDAGLPTLYRKLIDKWRERPI